MEAFELFLHAAWQSALATLTAAGPVAATARGFNQVPSRYGRFPAGRVNLRVRCIKNRHLTVCLRCSARFSVGRADLPPI